VEIVGPEQFGIHLICAMGDTEQDIPKVAQKIRDKDCQNHMFAFFPEISSLMKVGEPVCGDQWRRTLLT